MIIKKTKIGYLAPEIPALSATFVYNEILCLENKGFEVVPISVHIPKTIAEGRKIANLNERTIYLYKLSKLSVIRNNVATFIKTPFRYFEVLFIAILDSLKIGLTSRTGMGLLYRFLMASCVAEILKKNGCLHLHVHFAHIPTDIGMYASRLSGVPFSFTAHANDLFERRWLLKDKVERAGFTVTISEFNRRFLSNTGAPQEKIHVIRCGVDTGDFETFEKNYSTDILCIGSLGRMVEKKGFDILISACKKLKDKGLPFRLQIAGDGPLLNDLQNMVDTLKLSTHVSFIGSLPHTQALEWLRSLDLFVLACKRDRNDDMDGIPVVLMEAMELGIPVVSTRLSGIPELVEDRVTGFLADPGKPEGLALAMHNILIDETLRKNLCCNAVRRVQLEFDLSKNVAKLMVLFKEAIS